MYPLATVSQDFDNVVVTLHVASVCVTFGVMFAYPLFIRYGQSLMDQRGLPLLHRAQELTLRHLVNPGLVAVVVTGIVVAILHNVVTAFFAESGIVAAAGLGGLSGGYLAPNEGRLAALAERDLGLPGGELSGEYRALGRQVNRISLLAGVIVVVTILSMVARSSGL